MIVKCTNGSAHARVLFPGALARYRVGIEDCDEVVTTSCGIGSHDMAAVSDPRFQIGVWIGRIVGAIFVLVGVARVYLFWMRATPLPIDLVGVLMAWIGMGLISLRDTARKAAIAVGVLHVLVAGYALWLVVRNDQDQAILLPVLSMIATGATTCVVLLLPVTRRAFSQTRPSDPSDEEPLLSAGP
jgi:hypothetical protein